MRKKGRSRKKNKGKTMMYPILIRNISTLQVWYDSYTHLCMCTQVLYIHVYIHVCMYVVYRYHMCVHMHVPRYDVMYVLVCVQ